MDCNICESDLRVDSLYLSAVATLVMKVSPSKRVTALPDRLLVASTIKPEFTLKRDKPFAIKLNGTDASVPIARQDLRNVFLCIIVIL